MTEKTSISATRWPTPFERCDSDRLHLVRVHYPSCNSISYPDGPRYDLSSYVGDDVCRITVFSEADRTVYCIIANVEALRIHDERDLPQFDRAGDTGTTVRLVGSELQRSVSGIVCGNAPSYLIMTGNDCVEFLATGEVMIEEVGAVADSG